MDEALFTRLAQRMDEGAAVVLAELEPAQLAACRARLPALRHRVLG